MDPFVVGAGSSRCHPETIGVDSMSRQTTYETTKEVDILDAEGYATDRTALVHLLVSKVVDTNYGADADGNRGILLVEYEILDSWIEAEDLKKMNAAEAEQALKDAEAGFKEMNKHFY